MLRCMEARWTPCQIESYRRASTRQADTTVHTERDSSTPREIPPNSSRHFGTNAYSPEHRHPDAEIRAGTIHVHERKWETNPPGCREQTTVLQMPNSNERNLCHVTSFISDTTKLACGCSDIYSKIQGLLKRRPESLDVFLLLRRHSAATSRREVGMNSMAWHGTASFETSDEETSRARQIEYGTVESSNSSKGRADCTI